MSSDLGNARLIANNFRFSGDYHPRNQADSFDRQPQADAYFSHNSMEITPQVTPALAGSIVKVCDRLSIPRSRVKAYVYSSAELQAYCVSDGGEHCFIRLSSGLIDLLEPEELEFVAGHALGHFLLSHSISANHSDIDALETKILQRAQEVSADRIGLVACESLDVSIKALMKTVSGLNSEHLRFDVGDFIGQIRKIKGEDFPGQGGSSHPSMLVRCRALLWFSLSSSSKGYINSQDRPEELDKLDNQVRKDLNDYVDGSVQKEITILKDSVSMWLAAKSIVSDGKFIKPEQDRFSRMFGLDNLKKLKDFLSHLDSDSAISEVDERLESAKSDLFKALPHSFSKEYSQLESLIIKSFA